MYKYSTFGPLFSIFNNNDLIASSARASPTARMKLQINTVLLALFGVVCVYCTPQYYHNDLTKDAVVSNMTAIYNTVQALDQIQNDFLAGKGSGPNVEPLLLQLSKNLDLMTVAVQARTTQLDEHEANIVYGYSQKIQTDIANVTGNTAMLLSCPSEASLKDRTVLTLQTYDAGFDKLYRALEPKLPKEYTKVIAALFLAMICGMEHVIEKVKPGSKVVDSAYCSTYNTNGNLDLTKVPNNPWPTLPSVCKPFQDCGQSCSNVLKFGYQENAWAETSSRQWCTSTQNVPVWEACSTEWQPKAWMCPTAPHS